MRREKSAMFEPEKFKTRRLEGAFAIPTATAEAPSDPMQFSVPKIHIQHLIDLSHGNNT